MTNVKQNEVKETQNTKEQKVKVDKPKAITIASVFKTIATVGTKDRKELATKIIANLKAKGVTKNVRGYEIKEDRVLQQISAMLRDINMERGKDKKSWWSQFTVSETEDELKIIAKA